MYFLKNFLFKLKFILISSHLQCKIICKKEDEKVRLNKVWYILCRRFLEKIIHPQIFVPNTKSKLQLIVLLRI